MIEAPPTTLKLDNDEDFAFERQQIEDRRVDLAKEVDEESRRRFEAEEALDRMREEYLKKELEDSRLRSELEARVEQLESEKQTVQVKLVRVHEQYERGDQGLKEKCLSLEAVLQESRRAYQQLDETYKGLVEKAQSDKASAVKQCEKSYQVKIKSKLYRAQLWTRPRGDCEALQDSLRRAEAPD